MLFKTLGSMLAVWLLLLTVDKGLALTCLSCDAITHPRHCDVVATCLDNEVCFTRSHEAHDGIKAYQLGCVDRNSSHACAGSTNNVQCSECCGETDLCNAHLCNESGYPSKRGPICYSCESRLIDEPCNIIDFCGDEEVCSFRQKHRFSDIIYTAGCANKHVCDVHNHGTVLIGKREIGDTFEDDLTPGNCNQCCSGDLCNTGCGAAHDCLDILQKGLGTTSGIYTIMLPISNSTLQVYCDMETDGGGWTVMQHRVNGTVDFNQSFSQYEAGFGDLDGEFWLGLAHVHELSTFCPGTVLRIDLEKASGQQGYDTWANFSVSSAPNYILHVNKGTGTLGDYQGMSYDNNGRFATFDKDRGHCATTTGGGWWVIGCTNVNLNGVYIQPGTSLDGQGILYYDFDRGRSLKTSRMMIRRDSHYKC